MTLKPQKNSIGDFGNHGIIFIGINHKIMKPFTRIASVIFGIISLLHLLRLIYQVEIVIGSYQLPLWINAAGIIVTVILSIGLWKEANRQT
jgi:hypothetical protein